MLENATPVGGAARTLQGGVNWNNLEPVWQNPRKSCGPMTDISLAGTYPRERWAEVHLTALFSRAQIWELPK